MKIKKLLLVVAALTLVLSLSLAGCRPPIDPNGGGDNEVLTAAANAEYTRFTDSWRSVKQEGWGLNADLKNNDAKLNRALMLIDYFWSQEGNRLMSYGPDAWLDGNKTVEYNGEQIPKINPKVLDEMMELTGGNYTNYYRFYVGATFPIGYVKEQGMEYQTTHAKGKVGQDNIMKAIELGTMDHLQVYSNDEFEYTNIGLGKPANKVTLDIGIAFSADARMTFPTNSLVAEANIKPNYGNAYKGPDEIVYTTNTKKPVWRVVEDKLNIDITDLAATSYVSTSKNEVWQNIYVGTTAKWDIIGADAYRFVQEGGKGKILNLMEYMDKMPNFKAFLDANPFVLNTCLTDGALYYAPYFDGFDDLERMFMMRADWVQKLLDGDTPNYGKVGELRETAYTPFNPEKLNITLEVSDTETATADTKNTPITKKYNKNIITIQNELATQDGKSLTDALRAYIDTTYNGYYGTKRSNLFVGANAAYDADELVALLRCVKTNSSLLAGQDPYNHETKKGFNIIPFYPRAHTTDRTMDIFRLMEIWGVRGLDSRNNFLYVDSTGELRDTRIETRTLAALAKLRQLYVEGMFPDKFNEASGVSGAEPDEDRTFRGRLSLQNRGFMSYDYNQTSTLLNSLGEGANEDEIRVHGFNLRPVLPPYTDWGVVNEYTLSSVPTALPYTTGEQQLVDNYKSLNDDNSQFWLSSDNGKSGLSSFVWADLIMRGYGSDAKVGVYNYKFSSIKNFKAQVETEWQAKAYIKYANGAYQRFVNSLSEANG